MSDLLIGALSALLATNQPAALSNLVKSVAGISVHVPDRSDPLEAEFQKLMTEFREREIQIKDLDRGLIDFPAIIGGREVFLCWEQDEEDVEFWHELGTGYAGRERL